MLCLILYLIAPEYLLLRDFAYTLRLEDFFNPLSHGVGLLQYTTMDFFLLLGFIWQLSHL